MTTEIDQNQLATDSSDTVQLIRESVRDFAQRAIAPHVSEWDESQHFPIDVFHQLGELGLMGMLVPEQYGGAGLGYHEYVAAIVELSKVDGAVGLSMAAHNSLCTNHILMFGNEAQKATYLPQLATGQHLGAWGLTEPNTGSDAGNMRTRAVRLDNGDWLLNGAKNFITHGRSGDVAVVIARTGEPNTPRNATAFVVERGTPGFRGGKKENKLGMRASETAEMIFEDCRISDSQRLGEVGEGFVQSLKILDGGRISIAALSLGIAQGAYEAALAYARERQQFGQPIFNYQAISFKLADMATDIEASRLLIEQASELKNNHQSVTKVSAMAKLFASEAAVRVANEAVQILGGYGYIKDFPVEKFYRDAKLCTIGEGTSEIQKLVISRQL
ncbi:acyl-CoA dehydrogenase domain protein [Fibrella aestuarina BUZ 2]|uniref:Cyclohex-1-ene-1-carbonyl-CoA dehydrogenase n=1 Tax=Fibrella aestuarina BUZ 2 TaxID=1166018 RepID=I0K6N8_9BACT|nr:acyl-CoA dehydrogenase family protein [Fibrella aestuarina]CCG99791.1 acyl-CoA dehydrogenase domain protein [Fibrella aestuarina BUZ 2]